jgi:hypothetical protein
MLDALTAEVFDAYLGQPFDIRYGNNESLRVVLANVQHSPYTSQDPTARAGFSLLFQSAIRDYLPQGIYPLKSSAFNAAYGDLELFIVPLTPNAEGVQYEAIFN